MTTGAKKFYVVANEESLDLTDTDYPAKGTTTNPNDLLKVITDTERSHFPKLKGEVTSLPITGYKEETITADIKNIPIETYHAVAKIVFKVKNTSSEDITLTRFSLGQFLPTGLICFHRQPDNWKMYLMVHLAGIMFEAHLLRVLLKPSILPAICMKHPKTRRPILR